MSEKEPEAINATQQDHQQIFALFQEVGIISQLSSSMMNRVLPEGLHISHFSILNHLMRLGDGKTPLSIARAFQVTKGTMTHSIGVLEKRELIRLEKNPKDNRSKLVFLTDVGRTFHGECIHKAFGLSEKLLPLIDVFALQEILPVLTQLRTVLDDNRDI
jgi:DNA-binding MarR family transcriptional regulator